MVLLLAAVTSADELASPSVSSLSPASGSILTPSPVTIGGEGLGAATEVRFGSEAAVFRAISDDRLEAYSPPKPVRGAVDVTVITPAGTSAIGPADRFTYTACKIPNLAGKRLKAGREKLRKAGCKLGKVNGSRGRGAEVVSQTPRPGKLVPLGSPVNVRLDGA